MATGAEAMNILVTGGCGFIGSAVCRLLVSAGHSVVNVDKLTYAASAGSVAQLHGHANYRFHRIDICDGDAVLDVMRKDDVDAVIHLAAESHVDRSIDGPSAFVQTNIVGTFTLLQAARTHFHELADQRRKAFRFLHVSTDEVFGTLPLGDGEFTEETPYAPTSPYSASKAASDHLARAWHHTYGLPVLVTNCSNNYGHYQFPEKLIPLMIINAMEMKPLPVYGNGQNVRDWLHVDDHARALLMVLEKGFVGATYNIGGRAERSNLQVVEAIAALVDELLPQQAIRRQSLVTFVKDRPGHDLRYAIACDKIETELGWRAGQTFESGLRSTVQWYIENEAWWSAIRSGNYAGQRLGSGAH